MFLVALYVPSLSVSQLLGNYISEVFQVKSNVLRDCPKCVLFFCFVLFLMSSAPIALISVHVGRSVHLRYLLVFVRFIGVLGRLLQYCSS